MSMGDSLKEVKAVIGDSDEEEGFFHVWRKLGLTITADAPDKGSRTRTFYFYLQESDSGIDNKKNDVLLIHGVPVQSGMKVNEFFDNSKFKIDEFELDMFGYKYMAPCEKYGTSAVIRLMAEGAWNYSGGGHLMLKSGPNYNNTNAIRFVAITLASDI